MYILQLHMCTNKYYIISYEFALGQSSFSLEMSFPAEFYSFCISFKYPSIHC